MQDERLLQVTPDFLIRAILHRRQRLAEMIPKQLEARKDEKEIAETLARDAKKRRDEIKANLDEFSERLKLLEESTPEHKEMLSERDAFIEQAQKTEHEYLENELFRRRSDSRTKRLTHALNDCERSIEYWEGVLESGFEGLLENAKRVHHGGASSYALSKGLTSKKGGRKND